MKRAALAPLLVESLCRVSLGRMQCRSLMQDPQGFLCIKHDAHRRAFVDEREGIEVKADLCPGIYPWIPPDLLL